QSFAHAGFTAAVVIIPTIVHEIEAAVDGSADDADAFLFVLGDANVIATKAEGGDSLAGAAEGAGGHFIFFFSGSGLARSADGDGGGDGGDEFAAGDARVNGSEARRLAHRGPDL